jgi:hypothetical protein
MFNDFQDGGIRSAAKKIGVTPAEYLKKRAENLKWCGYLCKAWMPEKEFHDTGGAKCKDCRSVYAKKMRARKREKM